jgi:hypothetical protein
MAEMRINFMKPEEKKVCKKSKKPVSSIVLYVVASVVALIAVASLANNILLFKSTVGQYVAQGYPSTEVIKQLVPIQLLPGVFESLALYAGIAFALFAAGMINEKISKCLTMLTKAQSDDDVIEKSTLEKNVVNAENTDDPEKPETVEKANETVKNI